MMRMTDLNKYKFRSKTRQQNHHHQRKLQLQKIENQLIAFACGYKFINLLIDYGNPLTYDTIKRILKEQFGIFVLKYSSTPEARAAISKELTKLNEKEAIEKLHAILGINQIDDSNFMQFGDTPLADLLEINTKNIPDEDKNDQQ